MYRSAEVREARRAEMVEAIRAARGSPQVAARLMGLKMPTFAKDARLFGLDEYARSIVRRRRRRFVLPPVPTAA